MRFFIELQYLGTNYHGWQIQPDAISIQEVVQNTLSILLRENIEITGAGRTDAGVHAKQMFAHFNSNNLPETNNVIYRLNSFLPHDISVVNLFKVNKDAHARFDATSRSYQYHISLVKNPFTNHISFQILNRKLDINKMNTAASALLKYKDFKCFSKSKTDVRTYNCTVYKAKWVLNNNSLVFYITADRFLRNMVRAIVGTLIDVGQGKINYNDFINIIESKDRTKAGFSVPAKGLFLTGIKYPFIK